MKTILKIVAMVLLAGCAQTKQYTPLSIGTQYNLSGMPADIIRVQVNDLRAEKESSEQLVQVLKGQILSALSPEKTTGNRVIYSLNIDIIEHRSFFTLDNWNAATKLRIKLIDPKNNMVGNWIAEGNAHLSNMWGYATAKAVSQDAYNLAVADMMSILSAVSLTKEGSKKAYQ
jgi:dTDP-4-amino-4,6-dideoxygalactose transaminase